MNTDAEGYEKSEMPGIDVSKYDEVLKALSSLGIDPKSVKPVLAARELAVGEFAGTGICFGMGTDERQLARELKAVTTVAIRAVANLFSFEEASQVRSDMKRYFARHFPGRCLKEQSDMFGSTGSTVYIIFVVL